MRYAFIRANQGQWPTTRMCEVLSVSPSGYYDWRYRLPSPRAQHDASLSEKIAQIHQMSHATYGTPRLQVELRSQGIRCGRRRIGRLMRAAGLVTRCSHRRDPSIVCIQSEWRHPF